MRSMIKIFIKYPVLGNSILISILLFGVFGFSSLRTTFFPPVPSRNISVQASYPGASPEEIEEAIVLKIEDNLKGVTGIDRVTSVSRENSCSINVETLPGFDINVILQDVKNAVNSVSSFPVGMERLTVFKQEPRTFAIDFVLYGDVDLRELKKMARRSERELLAVDGISKVNLSGFPNEEIEIAFRENDLRTFGLTFSQVANALREANVKTTGGKIKGPSEELLIRANVKGYYAKELENHVIFTSSDGTIVRLKDVADCIDRWSENPDRVYHNGNPAVRLSFQNTNQEDLFFVANTVKEYIKDFNQKNDVVQAAVVRDGSNVIKERIGILTENGLLGLFLVVLLLALTLNPRLAFWVAVAIPVSFAGMFLLASIYGLTINVMSLMAMILVLGILVDDGIVFAENIYQHHERGAKPIDAAVNGTLEVLPAVVASIFTTVVIFMTFFFLEGGLGDRSKDIAFVVATTLLFSLVEGMFILPAHIAHSKALRISVDQKSRLEKFIDNLLKKVRDKTYAPSLRLAIHHPFLALSIPVAIFLITLGALNGSIIRTTFFPIIERRNVDVTLEMVPGTPVAVTDSILQALEAKSWLVNDLYRDEFPQAGDIITAVSRSVGPGTHQGDLRIELISGEDREWSSMQVQNATRRVLGAVPDAQTFQVGGRGGWGSPVSIALQGSDLGQLRAAKEKLKSELEKIDKLKDVVDDDPPGLREVNVKLKENAYALGLTTQDVLSQVRSGFFGSEAQRLLRGIDEVKIWVRYKQSDRSSIKNLQDMRIRLADGSEYPLRELADFEIKRGVMSINHIDAQRVVQVEADIADPKDSVPDILAELAKDVLPEIREEFPDVTFAFEGQSRANAKTTKSLKTALPITVFLMLFIVMITFRSPIQAFAVFILIPFSLIGVLWGHWIQGYIVSMLSFFGAIALAGIVVNDSLVLVNAMNRNLKNGMTFKDSIFQAGISRFRPVLLTSLTTIAGLGPLIFEKSHQAQFLSPMAISVAYGLLFGTALTLFMLPAVLVAINKTKIFLARVFTGKKLLEESVEPAVREDVFVEKY